MAQAIQYESIIGKPISTLQEARSIGLVRLIVWLQQQPILSVGAQSSVMPLTPCQRLHACTCIAVCVQLQERRAGNTAYQQQQYSAALHHYQRALAVVNFVVGQSSHDQAEIDYNKATVLLNMAAVHMALKVSPQAVLVRHARLHHDDTSGALQNTSGTACSSYCGLKCTGRSSGSIQ